MKIGFKLTSIMIILSLFSIGSTSIILLNRAWKNVSTLARDYTLSMAKESSNGIQACLESYWYSAETLAQVLEQYPYMTIENRRNMLNVILEGVVQENPEIIGVWCVMEPNALEGNDLMYSGTRGATASGRFAPYYYWDNGKVAQDVLNDFDNPDVDYYQLPKESNATTLLNPSPYDVSGKPVLMTSLAAPIRHNGKPVGVVGIDIHLEEIQEITQTNKPYPDAVTAVFSNNGTVTSHFDPARIGKNMRVTERDMTGPYMEPFTAAVQTGKEYSFTNYIEPLKSNMQIFLVPIYTGDSTTLWSYAIGITEKTVMAPVYNMVFITIVISFIILALVILAAIFISRSITKPIIKVADTLQDISEGEGDLTRSITVYSKDEIGKLAHYFNLTLEKIRNLIVIIKKESVTLSNVGCELSSNMTETAAAINQITANVQSIKGRIISQSSSVTETNATMEQITSNIHRLNGYVENQSSSISEASSAIEEMLANIQSVTNTLVDNSHNVHDLSSASEVGRISLQEVAGDIQEIARESEGLMAINSVMKNIASQTNLLSMNAAIEAAHAGDAGKGFAVVADEIRKLAESSGAQSKTISDVLKKIKSSIEKITRSTQNALGKFEAIDRGVRIVADQENNILMAMEEQNEGSKHILEGVSQVNNITRQVKDESGEMLEGSTEVIHESKNLESVTQEITGGMNEMAAGAEQINVAVTRVNEISEQNRENINTLVREVAKFKVE